MSLWLVLVLGGLLTFSTRLSFLLVTKRFDPNRLAGRMLRFVPVTVLTALIVPELFVREGVLAVGNERMVAGLVAAAVAYWTRSTILTIGLGMAVLLLLQRWG